MVLSNLPCRALLCSALLFTAACGSRPQSSGPELTPTQLTVNYAPRIGVAVQTASRTCVAIRNANLASASPMTLVLPNPPQSFTLARVGPMSEEACPITKDLDNTVSNYEITLPNGDSLPKNSPMIAVVGAPDHFLKTNITVQADLDSDGSARQFRACSTPDGIHLTVWAATPLRSPRLWHGFFYDPSNATGRPPCEAGDTAP